MDLSAPLRRRTGQITPPPLPLLPLPPTVMGSRLGTAMQMAVVAQTLYQTGLGWYRDWRGRRTYTVSVERRDQLYPYVHAWLLRELPRENQRSLLVTTLRSWQYDEDDDTSTPGLRLGYSYDGRQEVSVVLEGHPVRISLESEEAEGGLAGVSKLKNEQKIVLTCESLAGQEAVVRRMEMLAREAGRRENPRVYATGTWGDWRITSMVRPRPPESLVLAQGQYERLVADLERFFADETRYATLGIPWHRGYLFEGPPGTGKTSAALALANAFKLDVYYLPLSDIKSDTDLVALLSDVRERSVLLIEDIDIAHAAKSREDTDRVSAQGLLNALDGAITPHGLITIMTTNNIEVLDLALMRTGRCDLIEHMGYLTDEQLQRLVRMLTGESMILPALRAKIAPAQVMEVAKQYLNDIPGMRIALTEWLVQQDIAVSA